jgi:hypothetical protein
VTRQRVVAAVGCPKSSAWRRQRSSARPIAPEPSAASCSLREAVMDRRPTSAATALNYPGLRRSKNASVVPECGQMAAAPRRL